MNGLHWPPVPDVRHLGHPARAGHALRPHTLITCTRASSSACASATRRRPIRTLIASLQAARINAEHPLSHSEVSTCDSLPTPCGHAADVDMQKDQYRMRRDADPLPPARPTLPNHRLGGVHRAKIAHGCITPTHLVGARVAEVRDGGSIAPTRGRS